MANRDLKVEALTRMMTVSKKAVEDRFDTWERLERKFKLEYDIPPYLPDDLVKYSQFYPLVRDLIAATAIRHPRVSVRPKPLVEGPNFDLTTQATILERVLNLSFELIDVKREVHQTLFDMMFCGVGWLKVSYNPAGRDYEPPYTLNDRYADDFPIVQRIDPRRVFPSPLADPHTLSTCPIIFEEMFVPFESLKADERINKGALKKLKPKKLLDETYSDGMFDFPRTEEDPESLIRESREHGDLVKIYEAHDRLNRRLYIFAEEVDTYLFNEVHPFVDADIVEDQTGGVNIIPSTGFLLKNGFQYIPMKIDRTLSNFYPTPPLSYLEDLQDSQIEITTRSIDFMKRLARIVLIKEGEEKSNPDIRTRIASAMDGEVLTVQDTGSIQELVFSMANPGMYEAQQTLKDIEAESISAADRVLARGASRKTATEVGVATEKQGTAQLWMRDTIGELYNTVAHDLLSMYRDRRYMPKDFLINTAAEGAQETIELLSHESFLLDWSLDIDVFSMEPHTPEKDRDTAFLVYDRFIENPYVDPEVVTREALKSVGVRNVDRYMTGPGKVEAQLHAQKENTAFLMKGEDPGVNPLEHHDIHISAHQSIMEAPEFQQLDAQVQQTVTETVKAHIQQHEESKTTGESGGQDGGQLPSQSGGGPQGGQK